VIPERLARFTTTRLGAEGEAWLARLPALVNACEDRWDVVAGPPFLPGGAIAYVVPVLRADGSEAVVKISLIERENRFEGEALRAWDGRGAVRLLGTEPALGALLLERCRPGASLLALADEEAADVIALDVLATLWRPVAPGHPFELAADLAAGWAAAMPDAYFAAGRPLEERIAGRAAATLAELAATADRDEAVLLHQDVHHDNILDAGERGWLAIDPKPLAGERAFDAGALLRDRRAALLAGAHPTRAMARRLDRVTAATGLERERIRAWGFAQCVVFGLSSYRVGDPDGAALVGCARLLLSE
jgi:streptomycin 6-kinase